MSRGGRSGCSPRGNACSTAIVTAITLLLVMAPTASAAEHQSTGDAGDHSQAHTTKEQPDHISPGPSTDDGANKAEGPRSESDLLDAPGHDKCKRPKGARRLLPWCEDPASGWMGSTTHRV